MSGMNKRIYNEEVQTMIESVFLVYQAKKGYFRWHDLKSPFYAAVINTNVYACSCHRTQQEICSFWVLSGLKLSKTQKITSPTQSKITSCNLQAAL